MLDIKKVLTAKPKPHENVELAQLMTPWGEAIDQDNPLPEHPTPQARREGWTSLNGVWRCRFDQAASGSAPFINACRSAQDAKGPTAHFADMVEPDFAAAQDIVVPFSPEAPLSGVGRQLQPSELLWYERTFDAPAMPDDWRLVLHFVAVDYACAVWLNGRLLGAHVGGYTPFAFDIADVVRPANNRLVVCVADPSETGTQLRGKQRLSRGDIWYTAQSGIWQSVWLEWMPAQHVRSFSLDASYLERELTVEVRVSGSRDVMVAVYDAAGREVGREHGAPDADGTFAVRIVVPEVHPWSPEDPYLYSVTIAFGDDQIESYCGFRDVEVRADAQGTPRVHLNGRPIFLKGVLDQGYWPDGLMTAPADAALVHDIEQARSAGFNMLRKHIKVENPRWYYHCDRLGMLVWQDMVSGGDVWNTWHVSYKPTLFKASWDRYDDRSAPHQANLLAKDDAYHREWTATMRQAIALLRSHPSIITWVLFNEGWGQFDARAALEAARVADNSRPVDAVSGWYDQHCGDFKSVHNYFRPLEVWPDRGGRAFVVSEFGGLTLGVAGHTSLPDAYGYSTYDDAGAWRDAVHNLLAHMDALDASGLAGYVYTQLSDVEEEVNGILTYDRRINKLDGGL